ncbi:hypothetical protein APHAL10511_003626 [Amanita phalloides]|nr:hypothetical protein APHAL10511_003626 [Amanita phalloides]
MTTDAPTSTTPNELEQPGPIIQTRDQSDAEQPQPDPQVIALRSIFPDYDDGLLLSILQSVGGDQARAIDALLGMSDPQYKSEATSNRSEQALSQVDLDEQLARRLMLEEQETHGLPYQPYRGSMRRSHHPRPTQEVQVQGERGTAQEFQDHISRFAETGKKTFEGLFSRVKAKIQEYDKPNKASESPKLPSWSGTPATSDRHWSYDDNSYEQPSSYAPSPPLAVISSSPPSGNFVHAYDTEVEQGTVDTGIEPPRSEPTPGVTSPRTSIGTRPVATIDGGKLGLLPKRPVSLLKPQVATDKQAEPTRQNSLEDEDELEYTENPFEDPRS